MVEALPLTGPLGLPPAKHGVAPAPAAEANGTSSAASAPSSSKPAFRALLEDLERRAQDLARQSRAVDRPAELAGAVDTARASLADVLSLQERLLEAYRQSCQSSSARPGAPPVADAGP